jgi:hypothetical protein
LSKQKTSGDPEKLLNIADFLANPLLTGSEDKFLGPSMSSYMEEVARKLNMNKVHFLELTDFLQIKGKSEHLDKFWALLILSQSTNNENSDQDTISYFRVHIDKCIEKNSNKVSEIPEKSKPNDPKVKLHEEKLKLINIPRLKALISLKLSSKKNDLTKESKYFADVFGLNQTYFDAITPILKEKRSSSDIRKFLDVFHPGLQPQTSQLFCAGIEEMFNKTYLVLLEKYFKKIKGIEGKKLAEAVNYFETCCYPALDSNIFRLFFEENGVRKKLQ